MNKFKLFIYFAVVKITVEFVMELTYLEVIYYILSIYDKIECKIRIDAISYYKLFLGIFTN